MLNNIYFCYRVELEFEIRISGPELDAGVLAEVSNLDEYELIISTTVNSYTVLSNCGAPAADQLVVTATARTKRRRARAVQRQTLAV